MATWLTGKEAMAHLRLSPSSFYRLVRLGKIRGYIIEGIADPRYKKEELDSLMTPVNQDEEASNP